MVVVGSPCGILPLPQLLVLQQFAFVRQGRGLGREGAGPDQVAGEREGESRVRSGRESQVRSGRESQVRSGRERKRERERERVTSDNVERERESHFR